MSEMARTLNVAFIEVPPAAIFPATGARGQHDDEELIYEDCNPHIRNDDTNECFVDGITDLESAIKTYSAPLRSTRRLRSLVTAAAVPTAAASATK